MARSLWLQAECSNDRWNWNRLAIRLSHNCEATLIIPHCPADALCFQSSAGITQPCRAHCGIGERLVDPELTAVDRNMMQHGPFASETQL